MTIPAQARFFDEIGRLQPAVERYAADVVDRILHFARESGASDVHLLPLPGGKSLRMMWRIDGVLHELAELPHAGPNIVSRLKVLAELLTYKTDVPQEGRIRTGDDALEMRVSTFPTVHGEKAVVRLFVGSGRFLHLADLGLPPDLQGELQRLLSLTGGAVLVSGPAGSGKTTTLYACLRHILGHGEQPRSVCTLEDPIEALVTDVAQSQVKPSAGFDYAAGLRSLMRQDPEVIMVGEIRDRPTAETVFQAALTGQLILSSFHAGTAAEAVGRLLDLGIEGYLLRSGLLGILTQRLVRKLCACAQAGADAADRLGLDVAKFRVVRGCPLCGQTGYAGRMVLAEFLDPGHGAVGRSLVDRADSDSVQATAIAAGMTPLFVRALDAVRGGQTSPAEIRRVFGMMRNVE